MLPIDSVTGKLWSTDSATMALRQIKDKARADLVARDQRRGIGSDGKVYFDPLEDEEGKPGRFVIDDQKSRAKHTGGEYIALIKARWAEFCELPKDESAFIEAARTADRISERDKAMKLAETVEASLSEPDIPEGATRLVSTRRGRGRPRGSKNKTRSEEMSNVQPIGIPKTESAVEGA